VVIKCDAFAAAAHDGKKGVDLVLRLFDALAENWVVSGAVLTVVTNRNRAVSGAVGTNRNWAVSGAVGTNRNWAVSGAVVTETGRYQEP
jgi:hypothetical protein